MSSFRSSNLARSADGSAAWWRNQSAEDAVSHWVCRSASQKERRTARAAKGYCGREEKEGAPGKSAPQVLEPYSSGGPYNQRLVLALFPKNATFRAIPQLGGKRPSKIGCLEPSSERDYFLASEPAPGCSGLRLLLFELLRFP